jgi:hypothetical protein
MTTETIREWWPWDNEPEDLPHVRDAHGVKWWCSKTERDPQQHDGWRSDELGYFDKPKTWWWLVTYRGPLREVEAP